MKKTMKTLAALGLVCAMGTVSFAAESNTVTVTNPTGTVKAQYVANSEDPVIVDNYSVSLEWSDLSAKYTAGKTTYTWNTDSLSYVDKTADGTWSNTDISITVKNRSSKGIKATAAYTAKDSNGSDIEFANNAITVATAATNGTEGQGKEQSGTITGTLKTDNIEAITAEKDLGTITVTIEKVQ